MWPLPRSEWAPVGGLRCPYSTFRPLVTEVECKMPKGKSSGIVKGFRLRHDPLGEQVTKPGGKLKAPKAVDAREDDEGTFFPPYTDEFA